MHFTSFSAFFAMGGYAIYVWSAFAITFGSLLWLVISVQHTRRKLFIEIKKRVAREQRIKKSKKMENTL